MSDISLSQLEAGVHFGHKAYRWNPKMFPYIYSEVNNIHICTISNLFKRSKCLFRIVMKENLFICWYKTTS
jgi:ribosomal protein S2